MDEKRELTSVDLAALAGELDGYEGARLDKAYLYPDRLLRLKLRDFDRGRIELLAALGETKHVRVAAPENVPPAPERPPNFAMMLRNRIEGAELVDVEQFEFDRILTLRFERDDGSTTIVVELFGDGNVAVLDETGEVIDCLETVRLKSRTVAPGAQYEFPDARFDPLVVDQDSFATRLARSDTDVVRTLATRFNFGGTWAEEICTRAGVEKTLDVSAADGSTVASLHGVVEDLGRRLRGGDPDARVYRSSPSDDPDDGRRVDVTPVPMSEYAGLDAEPFDSFLGALDDYFTNVGTEETETAGRDRPEFEAEIEERKRIIEQQQGAIESFERQADRERETAEALYANYDLVDELLSTVRSAREAGHTWDDIADRFAEGAKQGIAAAAAVESVDGSEGTVTLEIDGHSARLRVRDGVEKNADRIYREAKRIEEKKAGAETAIANTRAELEQLERDRESWEPESGSEPEADGEPVDWLSRSSIPVRQTERWYERFRWFHTSDDFLVIGGRNADQNEELVKKYLDRGDLFFHARAHGGPVTVLKATGPSESYDEGVTIPDRSKREAARFAVSYASVWKDGRFSADAYMVAHDQVSKTPESGEYLEKGGFAVRGDRTYFENTAVGVAVGIACEPETRVVGGPPAPVESRAETSIRVEPGKYAQNDIAKRLYRAFKPRFADEAFVRKVASPDRIQEFLPPGQSSVVE